MSKDRCYVGAKMGRSCGPVTTDAISPDGTRMLLCARHIKHIEDIALGEGDVVEYLRDDGSLIDRKARS